MEYEFENVHPVTIDPRLPGIVMSTIDVLGVEGRIRDVQVALEIEHSWTSDLIVTLVAPDGTRVVLVDREGGSGDDFSGTIFDDSAVESIVGAESPFTGSFRPHESSSAFDGKNANGTWTLEIDDRASLDGGELVGWVLGIESCCNRFTNDTPIPIDPGPANTIISPIAVTGFAGLVVDHVTVSLEISHTWDADLTISLESPDGHRVLLVDREGGNRDDFRGTVFTDAADRSVVGAEAPFTGRFRPEGDLSEFRDRIADGYWLLEIRDTAVQDGGVLESWSLEISTRLAEPRRASEFDLQVRFLGGLTPAQRSVFQLAAARWSEVIVGDLPSVESDGEVVDDIVIDAEGVSIDGRGSILGQAGPTVLRAGTLLPARGIMSFDVSDLEQMEEDGSLIDVILHEMGHVLGVGTLWSRLGFLQGAGSIDPRFIGASAMREYGLLRSSGPQPVPVANTGGPGTRDGHWRESVFGHELMTGFIEAAENPISRVTIAALEDLGYEVNYDAADAFVLPTALRLSELGIGAEDGDHGGRGITFFPDQRVLPTSAYVDPDLAGRR